MPAGTWAVVTFKCDLVLAQLSHLENVEYVTIADFTTKISGQIVHDMCDANAVLVRSEARVDEMLSPVLHTMNMYVLQMVSTSKAEATHVKL